jgi:hypothetical protein
VGQYKTKNRKRVKILDLKKNLNFREIKFSTMIGIRTGKTLIKNGIRKSGTSPLISKFGNIPAEKLNAWVIAV